MTEPSKMTVNKQDSQLGTLEQLPQEIRDKIYTMVFDDHLEATIQTMIDDIDDPHQSGADILLERDFLRKRNVQFQPCLARYNQFLDPAKPVKENFLDLRWYLPLYGYQDWFELRLRQASSALRNQFETYFLSNYAIKFDCPNALSAFFSGLPAAKQMSLRRITIQICTQCNWCEVCKEWTSIDDDTERWMRAIEGLPATALESLTVVNFEVGTQGLPQSFGGRAGYWWDWVGGYCETDFTPVMEIGKVAKALSVFAGELRRRVPNVRIGLSEEECYLPEDRDIFRAAVMCSEGM